MARTSNNNNAQLVRRAKKVQRVPPAGVRKRLIATAIRRWRLFGAYIGQRKRRGRWTREISLVCLTTDKQPMRQLPKGRRIPRVVTWRERARTYRLATDVIEATAELTLQSAPIAGPCDSVHASDSRAMIGAVIMHPNFGRCLTTAGHLFSGPRPIGQAAVLRTGTKSLGFTVRQCVRQGGIDYALMSPDSACDCDNLFQDVIRIGPVFIPEPSGKGRQLFVLNGVSDSQPTVCRGVNATLVLSNGIFDDVILTDAVTDDGESGTALVDGENRVWGFLIGANAEFSVFMPAHALLWREQSQLV